MSGFLRQSTAVDVLIGPFVDTTDGYTAEAALSPAVKLSKNGQTLTAKNDVTTPVHDADGYYNCEFDTTDTNTVGTLVASIVGSATSLPVRHEWQVLDEAAYDALFGSTATILTSADIGLMYESAITTVTSQTEFIMTDAMASDNIWRYLVVSIEDISTGEFHVTWCTSVVQSTESLLIDSAAPFTVVSSDVVRVYAVPHPRAAINNYAPATAVNLATVDTVVDAVKVKTDQLTFSTAGFCDANVMEVNDNGGLTGDGDATPVSKL